ncbi:MAG TPA: CNNM domain-containing protein [Burkholderiales bacterium]|jgi:Mg2+/Co2+ transporter CorB|nr:CNNM domain-containing protein [Burkholderiales bacterium]
MEYAILASLILLNGVLAMSEVAVLTSRRTRLATMAASGDRLSAAALRLVEAPTRFLSTVQIGITSIGILNGIIGEAALAAPVAIWLQSLGLEQKTSAVLATGTVVLSVTYVSIVIGELVPKRLGQHNAESIARLIAWPMRLLARIAAPFVSLLSLSTDAILKPLLVLLRIRPMESGAQPLSPEEIRALVLESSTFMPKKHVTILLNLFDLSDITVQDIMLPRSRIESVKLDDDMDTVARHLATSYHMRLPVFRDARGEVVGILHLRKVLAPLHAGTLNKAEIESLLAQPYFVPATTPVFAQMQYFQENQERIALVVDEYGELMGLVTLEDIIEEIIGKFTTSLPSAAQALAWGKDGWATADGATPVREVNRALGLDLPTEGPKTLNGLILEHLRDIPEADVSIKIGDVPMEIVHAQGRAVKTVRIFRPALPAAETTEGL